MNERIGNRINFGIDLISCIILVILASIFGAKTWIIFVTIGVFRLIFMLFFAKLNPVLKTL